MTISDQTYDKSCEFLSKIVNGDPDNSKEQAIIMWCSAASLIFLFPIGTYMFLHPKF